MSVISQEYLSQLYGRFWTKVWQDSGFLDALLAGNQEAFSQLDLQANAIQDVLCRLTVPVQAYRHFQSVWLNESDMERSVLMTGTFDMDAGVDMDTSEEFPAGYLLAVDVDDISMIMDSPINPAVVWNKGQDFSITDRVVRLFRNPFDNGFIDGASSLDGEPDRRCRLWLCSTGTEDTALKEFYGQFVKLYTPSTSYYKRLVNAAWDLAVLGATASATAEYLCAIADTDICKAAGAVTAIWTEADRRWILVGGIPHSAPSTATELVSVGDAVTVGQILFDSVRILKGTETLFASELPALHLGSGFLSSQYTGGISVENATKTITTSHFPIGGHPDTVAAFWADVDAACTAAGINLWAVETVDQPGPTYTLNPFEFIRENFLKNNCFFVVFNMSVIPDPTANLGFISLLSDYLPAGTTFIGNVFAETPTEASPTAIADSTAGYEAGVSSDVDTGALERYSRGSVKLY